MIVQASPRHPHAQKHEGQDSRERQEIGIGIAHATAPTLSTAFSVTWQPCFASPHEAVSRTQSRSLRIANPAAGAPSARTFGATWLVSRSPLPAPSLKRTHYILLDDCLIDTSG
jgi:hypothetical protein